MRAAFELFEWILAFGASALALSIFLYSAGSFVLMRSHTTARTFGVSFRELAREVLIAALTQPFLPLFYIFGRRMEPLFMRGPSTIESSVPVVFVHGYMQNRIGFFFLARVLAKRAIGPLYGFNYPWFASIGSNAKRLEQFVDRVCEETNSAAVDLVCHSMGGLVAMEMLRDQARASRASSMNRSGRSPAPLDGGKRGTPSLPPIEAGEGRPALKVRRCVTIATPHAGIVWRGPLIGFGATNLRRGSKLLEVHAGYTLKLPTLSVFSSHDNIVHPKETSHLVKRGGRDLEVEGVAHLSILFAPAVAEHVASFLLEPGSAEPAKEIVPAYPEAQSMDRGL